MAGITKDTTDQKVKTLRPEIEDRIAAIRNKIREVMTRAPLLTMAAKEWHQETITLLDDLEVELRSGGK